MKSYSQRDGRWANIRIGDSSLTIGRFGCVITCIADLSTYFGDNLLPNEVANIHEFTTDGQILWNTGNYGHMVFSRREYGRHNDRILHAIKHPDLAVILQVANKSHWVVAINAKEGIDNLGIADPWLGDKTTMKRYNNNITGAAYFLLK